MDIKRLSFQDPDGFVFRAYGKIYRAVLKTYSFDFERIKKSTLWNSDWFVKHIETEPEQLDRDILGWIYTQIDKEKLLTVFELEKIEFITYPWEWTPTMLRLAAEFTLSLQSTLVKEGFTLKDASFYNIQFVGGQPVFIDLLSVKAVDGNIYPWFAYGQFLMHFAFPLTLIRYGRFNTLSFLQAYPQGISKAEVSKHLKFSSYFSAFELLNIHLFKQVNDDTDVKSLAKQKKPDNKQTQQLTQLIDFAKRYIKTLGKHSLNSTGRWINYYQKDTSAFYGEEKERVFISFLDQIGKVEKAVDLGANTGAYSKLLLQYTSNLLSVEEDVECCEILYKNIYDNKQTDCHWQLACNNLLHPSPGIGWLNAERLPIFQRLRSPLVVALAIIHHIYFSGSIELAQIAEMFNTVTTKYLIAEFVDKDDDKVILLAEKNKTRLSAYSRDNFIEAMNRNFIVQSAYDSSVTRHMFLFIKKTNESANS